MFTVAFAIVLPDETTNLLRAVFIKQIEIAIADFDVADTNI